jgi:hypothetical protein
MTEKIRLNFRHLHRAEAGVPAAGKLLRQLPEMLR